MKSRSKPQVSGNVVIAPIGNGAVMMFDYSPRHQAADQKTIADRKWSAPLKPPAPQQPCDVGLFNNDANQLDLIEMFQDPTNGD